MDLEGVIIQKRHNTFVSNVAASQQCSNQFPSLLWPEIICLWFPMIPTRDHAGTEEIHPVEF